MSESVKIRLHVMSPIHIGCGEVYEPTSFRVDSEAGTLHTFDPLDLIDSLDDAGRKALEKVSCGDDLLAIIKEIARLASLAKVPPLSSVGMAKGLLKHYDKVLKRPTYDRNSVINQFTLERTAYNPNGGFPYIPGSSIKGAIRTAYLNYKNGGKPCHIDDMRKVDRVAKELEKRLLEGSFEDDPFRLLKVPDLLPAHSSSTRLIYAVNIRKKGGIKGVPQILETITPGSAFEGVLSLNQPPPGAKVKPLPSIASLLRCLNVFCFDRYQEDQSVLDGINATAFSTELGDRINKYATAFSTATAFRIRLGRHGGAESHTLDGVRKIKIMRGKETPVYLDHATTIWLAAEDKKADKGMPFGWAVLEVLPVDGGVNTCCDRLRDEQAAESGARRAEARQKAVEEAARKAAEEERLRKIAEEQRKLAVEEARRKAEWELLSEDERLVKSASLPNVTEQQIVECYNKLDSLASPVKEQLATAIQDFYVKTGKWNGGSKKQMEKVKKLKGILCG